jgi:hypothetical protein
MMNPETTRSAMCGRLRVGKDFLHECSIGRCGHVFVLSRSISLHRLKRAKRSRKTSRGSSSCERAAHSRPFAPPGTISSRVPSAMANLSMDLMSRSSREQCVTVPLFAHCHSLAGRSGFRFPYRPCGATALRAPLFPGDSRLHPLDQ